MYQFFHIETYARQAHKAKKSNWTARDIADEADRKPEACKHVGSPKPPNVLFGVTPSEAVDFAEQGVAKEKDSMGRKIRSDRAILLAGVASYPKDGERYEEWKALTLDWLKAEYGTGLRSVVEHLDEEHPHVHFYVVANEPSKTKELHHGEVCADIAIKAGRKNEAGKEYRRGMTELQDLFYKAVAIKVGLARTGPKRARLSNEAYAAEKAKNLMVADAMKHAQIKESEADALLERAFNEAETKSKEATDILRKASDTVRQAVQSKLSALIGEERRIDSLGKLIDKVAEDPRVSAKIQAARNAYQSEGTLESRVPAKVAQLGGTQAASPKVGTRITP
jgi:hypothetical protein